MRALLLGALLVFSGCAEQSLDARIDTANRGVTLVLASTDQALNQHLITSAQAASVAAIAHQVNPLLDSAHAAALANDASAANKTLNLVNQLLAGLQAYVPPAKP